MVSKEKVLALVAGGRSYEEAARQLGVPPGQAYLVATGLPADGSDDLASEDLQRPGIQPGSLQALVNPPVHPGSRPQLARSFLKSRVEADPVLRDAARSRDAAPPPRELPEEEEERYDVVDVLGRDHGQVNYLLKELKTVPAFSESGKEEHAERRKSILDMIIVHLSAHEAAEEALFWPAVSRWLGSRGREFAETAASQEQEAKGILAELEKLPATAERFDELASTLEAQLRRHVAFEDLVFLQVKACTETPDRVELGEKVVSAERRGPTRPHARVGSSSGSQRLGPVVGAIDKARDAVSGRPAARKGHTEDELADEAG